MSRLVAITRVLLTGLLMLSLLLLPAAPAVAATPAAHGPHAACAHAGATNSDGSVPAWTTADMVAPCPSAPSSNDADDACCISPQCAPALAGIRAAEAPRMPLRTATRIALPGAGLPDGIGVRPDLPPPRPAA